MASGRPKLVDWVEIGEGIGYLLAFVVLGPPAALERRTRRLIRTAFHEWSESLDATVLALEKRGSPRCALMLPTTTASIPIEATVDPFERTAAMTVTPPQLPAFVNVVVSGSPSGLRASSETLDEQTRDALIQTIAAGPFGHGATNIDIRHDRIDVSFAAPKSVSEWQSIATAVVEMCGWLADKWPSSYRT